MSLYKQIFRVSSVFAGLLCVKSAAADTEEKRPNIVIALCDDMNPFYTAVTGDPDALTPHLNSLAKESAVFTRCYAASTVCMPSRTSLVTALYPHSTGSWGNANDQFIPLQLTSMFSDFKNAGYTTAMIGKTHWFSGTGFKQQFDSKKDYYNAMGIDYIQEVATMFASRGGHGVYQDFLKKIGKFEANSKDMTDRLRNNQYLVRPSLLEPDETCDWMMTDFATDYIQSSSGKKPFMMMVGYSYPHSPYDPLEEYAARYESGNMALRDNVKTFEKYGTEYSLEKVRETRAAYLAKISYADAMVGRLVDALKAQGSWDNTIVVFTADHGMAIGEHGNITKGKFWEEVARVPMIIRIPGLTDDGVEISTLSQLIDLYPTLLDAVGGEPSPYISGTSLMPAIHDPDTVVRDAVFCEIEHDGILDYMVRGERYKWYTEKGVEYLYDLEEDPFEQSNLIRSEKHEDVLLELQDRLRRFLMTEQVNYAVGYKPLVQREKEKVRK